jgi:hypothetical protein
MLRLLDRVLNGLAALEIRDSQTRKEVDDVERSLHGIRDMLYGNRWVRGRAVCSEQNSKYPNSVFSAILPYCIDSRFSGSSVY